MTLSIRVAAVMLYAVMLWPAFAQHPDMSSVVAQCDGKFGLCRYVDQKTKREVITARFERAMPFSEGIAAVRIDGKFGYIDHRGEVVIAPRFDLAGDFHQGLAEVVIGENAGVVNRQGQVVVPSIFQRAIPLTNEVVLVAEGKWAHGRNEAYLRPLPGWDISGKAVFGLYHVAGHWIRKPDLTRFVMFDEGRGLVWATEKSASAGPFGLLASGGEWVVEPQYERVGPLRDERAVVAKTIGGVRQFGAVNRAGQLAVPFQFLELLGWSNGWGIARHSGPRGPYALLDRSGAVIGGRYFDFVEQPVIGDIAVVRIDGRAMGLDRAGNIVPHPRNGRIFSECPSGIRIVEMDGRIQITDARGQPTTHYLFEQLNRPLPCDRPYMIRFDTKWGFVGIDGRLLSDPPGFDEVQDFRGGYAAVRQGRQWGIIDTTGHVVFEPKFDQYLGSHESLFHFENGGRKFWLDLNGEERPEPPLPRAQQIDPARVVDCRHGLRIAERGGQWGIVDGDGTDIIAPRLRAITCFENGVAWAPVDSRREWCAIGRDGALRLNECRRIHYPYVHMHAYPEIFHPDPFENSVLWTQAFLEFGMGRRNAPPEWIYNPPPGYPR
ncbi:MAG TPA: WG repeat-containing protein [Xanthobacteraceae bacterium]|nr:WG repeat-containing protein [Xanthobacteraceae bacterium]